MLRKMIFSFAILLLSFQFTTAQNNVKAEKILTDLLASAKTNAIKTNFNLTTTDKNNPGSAISNGTFTLKGNKFVLEMTEMKAWFDGKTQWSFMPQSNEVSITEPSEKELSETNPMAILSGFKSKCTIQFSKTKSVQNHCIEMIPKIKNKDITKIIVEINKTNGNLFSIKIINKNGSTSLLTLTNFQKGIDVTDNTFVFNTAKHKGVLVNDLR